MKQHPAERHAVRRDTCLRADRCGGLPRAYGHVRIMAVVCLLWLLVSACSPLVPPTPQPATATGPSTLAEAPDLQQSTIYALLFDAQLLAVRRDGTKMTEISLAPTPPGVEHVTGHYLALAQDRRQLYVLVPGQPQMPDRIAVVDTATGQLQKTFTLGNGAYHSLAVGTQSGRLYLFGNLAGGAIVTLVDPENGAEMATWIAREADGRTWLVYQGAVSADERHLYLAYHGPDTTGIDRFDVAQDGLHRCPPAPYPNSGCFATHGGFALHGDRLLVATGGSVILEMDQAGVVRRGVDTGLAGNHLMEFLVDVPAERLYAVGSCGYAGGFSAVSLRGGGVPATLTPQGEWRWTATPPPPQVLVPPDPPMTMVKTVPCGERLALGPAGLVVVGKTQVPVPQPNRSGALLLLDTAAGRVVQTITTSSEPLDVLVAPSPPMP